MRLRLALLALILLATPALADITVTTHYTLVNGDTLTRNNYYARKQLRVTGPDGKEFLFNAKTDSVTVIDHATKRYWTGPRANADSVARVIMNRNREGVPDEAVTDPVAWGEKLQAFNDSIRVVDTAKFRKIAGYNCGLYVLTAGQWLRNERWVARALYVPNYGPEMRKTVMATIKDPMGRKLMELMIGMHDKEGLPLASYATYKTLQREGHFSFEAVKVGTKSIPKSAWAIPAGYEEIKL